MSSKLDLGKQHEAKPVTAADKVMSKRHLKNRAKLVDVKGRTLLQKSNEYNKLHAQEHLDAIKENNKKLKKQAKGIKKAAKEANKNGK